MFWYLIVFAVLFGLALIEKQQRWPGIAAACILALMCGLRYETGFDWVEYEAHYLYIPGFFENNIYINARTFSAEPAFDFLNSLLKTFNADFQWLIFIIGVFNLFILYKFIRKFSPMVVPVLLWYYGFVFLTGQMATMRQALSVSFIYLAILYRNENRIYIPLFFCSLAVAFHSFSLVFVPIVFATINPWGAGRLSVFAAIGLWASFSGNDLFVEIAQAVLKISDSGLVSEKLEIYSSQIGANISPISLLLIIWHVFFTWINLRNKDISSADYILRISIWSTWLSVAFHAFFAPFPILWNRSMLVTFVIQAIQLCRAYHPALINTQFRIQFVSIAGTGSLIALIYALIPEQSLVFKPYQNLAVVWIRGPYGNGRLRYQAIRNQNAYILQEQKR